MQLFKLLLVIFAVGALFCPIVLANNQIEPKASLVLENAPKKVVIAISEDFAPFHFMDYRGKPSGMFVDLWNRWSEVTGIDVEYKAFSWSDTLQNLKRGKVDIHAGLFKSAKRDLYLDFGIAIFSSETHFFYHKSILGLNEFEDLIPFKIGILKGDFAQEFIGKRLPEATLSIYPDNLSLFNAVESGEIKVFVKDTPTARYHLSQRQLLQEYKFSRSRPLYSNLFYFAVKEGNSKLLSIIEEGMKRISNKEKTALQHKWMDGIESQKRAVLKIALPDNQLPYSGLNGEGKPMGLFVDIWRLWSKNTGLPLEFKVSDHNQVMYLVDSGQADILVSLALSEELNKNLIFSQPFYKSVGNLFYHISVSPKSLASMTEDSPLGVVAESSYLSQLTEDYPKVITKTYADHQEMIKAALSGDIYYFVYDTSVILKALEQLGASGQFNYDPKPVLEKEIRAGVTKEDLHLLKKINSGLDRIAINDLVDSEKKWLQLPELAQFKSDGARQIPLTRKEQIWLNEHKHIKLGADPEWPPFDYLDEDGETHQGMAADFVRLLNYRLGLKMKVVPLPSWKAVIEGIETREIDVVACIAETEDRKEFISYTNPYLSFSWVIITRTDFEFVGSVIDLLGKRVAVVSHYAIEEKLMDSFPDLDLIRHSSPLDGLRAVSEGKSDAYVGNLVTASYLIRKYNMTNLKVAAPTGLSNDLEQLRLGVRKDWPILVSILNKGLASINDERKTKIKQKWFSILFEQGIDANYIKTIVLRVVLVFIGILAAILLWNRRLKAEITRRKAAEYNLLEARDAAEGANRAKSVFLSNMSHEIRTPMNAILGFSQVMLRDTSINEEQKKSLRTIWRSGEHLLDLINEILEMSKIEAGRVTINLESFDLFSFLHDLEMMFRVRTEAKGIFLTVQKSQHLPQNIKSDQGKLRQILINLLGNAVKFTDDGGIVLRAFFNDDQKSLCFEVEDSGAGIPENLLGKIFMQFEQAVGGRGDVGGTGLGLAISMRYAELMNGSIDVTSTLEKGSLFRLQIPFIEAVPEEIELKKPSKRVICLKKDQEEIRVLIADDQEANRELMIKTLSAVGFVVDAAINGLEAIEKYKLFKPQLILMDIVMPKMDGIEATQIIKKLPGGQDVVIFAITASVLEGEKEKILATGAAEFIRKPFREGDLLQKIESHLQVEFEYEEKQLTANNDVFATGKPLTSVKDNVQQLPQNLIEQLLEAVSNGYIKHLQQLIEQVAQLDEKTANHLSLLAQEYDYEKIIDLLK